MLGMVISYFLFLINLLKLQHSNLAVTSRMKDFVPSKFGQ